MNIIVCFRNGISAAIASSADNKLFQLDLETKSLSLKELGLNIKFINLDKRNLYNVLEKKVIKPDYIYLYEDENSSENNIKEFIKKNYPDINIISYNKENSIQYKETFVGYGKNKVYILNELILKAFNNTLKKEEKYIVNTATLIQDLHVGKMNMTELDIQTIKNNNIYLFDTEKEADEFILKEIKENVCSIEKDIENLRKDLEKKETMLNRYEAILEQKEQDFIDKYNSEIEADDLEI